MLTLWNLLEFFELVKKYQRSKLELEQELLKNSFDNVTVKELKDQFEILKMV